MYKYICMLYYNIIIILYILYIIFRLPNTCRCMRSIDPLYIVGMPQLYSLKSMIADA